MAAEQIARTREYETIYILRPEVSVESARKVAARMEEVTQRENGRITLVESWGRRTLSYPLKKCRRGVYVYFKYLGGGVVVSEIERNLRMLDDVLKYQTVLVRRDVELDKVAAVAEEDTKFTDIEPLPADEPAETREAILGIEFSRTVRRDEEDRHDNDDDDSDNPFANIKKAVEDDE